MECLGEKIYKQIVLIIEDMENSSNRTLEEYLKALRYQASKHTEEIIKINEFLKWLKEAFWQDLSISYIECTKFQNHFLEFEKIISQQILDLESMGKTGQILDPLRYLGICLPNGENWYNFSVGSFLECAARGFFMNPNNSITLADSLTWGQISDFLVCGQIYE